MQSKPLNLTYIQQQEEYDWMSSNISFMNESNQVDGVTEFKLQLDTPKYTDGIDRRYEPELDP